MHRDALRLLDRVIFIIITIYLYKSSILDTAIIFIHFLVEDPTKLALAATKKHRHGESQPSNPAAGTILALLE